MLGNSGISLLRMTQILEAQAIFSRAGLSLSAAQAILFIAIACSEWESPMLPTGSDVARAIKRSQSRTSRLLTSLLNDTHPYIGSDRELNDGKSESFFITEEGRLLVGNVLSSVYGDGADNRFYSFGLESYFQKYASIKRKFHVRAIGYNTSGLSIDLESFDNNIHEELSRWMEFNNAPSRIERLKDFTRITFPSESFGVLFMCRWGIPIR